MALIDSNHYFIVIEYMIFFILALLTIFSFKKKNLDVIKARAYLYKNFIVNNFIYILFAGSLLAVHEFFEIGEENGYLGDSYHIFSEGMENLALVLLIVWMYSWFRLTKPNVKSIKNQ